MYRTFLVPLDGSQEAERPLSTVAALARVCFEGGRVVLVRSSATEEDDARQDGPVQVRAMEDAEAYLRSVAGRLMEDGTEVNSITAYGGATTAILSQSLAQRADVIAMATHARWGVDRLVHGSLAETIIAQSALPVLLFGPECRSDSPMRRMLIPLDGGPFTAAVLPEAARFCRAYGLERVDMVSILPPQIVRMDDLEGVPPPWALEKMGIRPLGSNSYALDEKQPIIRERQSELEHALEYWSDWLTESGATVQTHVRYEMSLRSTAASILHAASELDADVIAMRTHARRGLSRAMTGSVADEILRMSTVPILLYTTQTLDAQAEAIPAASLEIKITSS